jgi:hypothetical protein
LREVVLSDLMENNRLATLLAYQKWSDQVKH